VPQKTCNGAMFGLGWLAESSSFLFFISGPSTWKGEPLTHAHTPARLADESPPPPPHPALPLLLLLLLLCGGNHGNPARKPTDIQTCPRMPWRHGGGLRLLEAGPFPKWTGAWNDPYIGHGAAPVCEGVSSRDFRANVLAQVARTAPAWLLFELDLLPLRLDSVQALQHFRCEARKFAGTRRLPRYRLGSRRCYRKLFEKAEVSLQANLKHCNTLVEYLSRV